MPAAAYGHGVLRCLRRSVSRRRGPEPGAEPQEIDLVEEAEPHDDPEEDPESRPAPVHDEDKEIGGQGPKEMGESVHLEDRGVADDDRRQEDGQAGQDDGRPAAAQPPRDETGEHDNEGVGDGRQDADPELGGAEKRPARGHQEHGERRMVHVARGQALAAGDVVVFVPEDAVAAEGVDEKMEGERGERERQNDEGIALGMPGVFVLFRKFRFACRHDRLPAQLRGHYPRTLWPCQRRLVSS